MKHWNVILKGLMLLFLGLTAGTTACGQKARDCFVQMPDSVLPLLTAVNRADFIDFMDSRMRAEVSNRLNGKSRMTSLTDDYIALQLTEQSTWQMKLLSPDDSTKVICVVATACAPVCDSRICFYSTDWKLLPTADYLPQQPVLSDFVKELTDPTAVYAYDEALLQADMLLMEAELSSDSFTLTFRLTTPQYMDPEVARPLKPYLRDSIVYGWDGAVFAPLQIPRLPEAPRKNIIPAVAH